MNFFTSTASNPAVRKFRISFIFLGVALLAAYQIAGYIVANDIGSLTIAGMLAAGAAIAIVVVNDWRKGIYFFLTWLLFEDLARKYLGNNMGIYFAKDFLLLVVYLSFLAAHRKEIKGIKKGSFRPPFWVAVLVLIWFGFLQAFNPASTSIWYGFLGMKLYFYYVPLMFVGYALMDSEEQLRKFFNVNFILIVIIVLLGIVQSIAGPRFLNPAVMADDIRLLSETYRVSSATGERVYRPTSVFVSTSRFSDMLIVAWPLMLGFSGYLLLRRRRGRLFAFLALAITAGGCLMCASRGVIMWLLIGSVIGAAAFMWGAPWRQGEVRRVVKTLQRIALGIALAVVVLLFAFPEAFLDRLAVYSETLDPRNPSNELMHRTHDYPLAQLLAVFDYPRWPYGYGIGTVSLGGQYVSRFFHVRPPVGGVESGFGCLIIEMGIGGLILWFIMSGAILLSAWKIVRKLRGSPWFPIGFMIFWYAFILLLPLTFAGIQAYQDFIMNTYLWLLLGMLFRLPQFGVSAQLAASSGATAISGVR